MAPSVRLGTLIFLALGLLAAWIGIRQLTQSPTFQLSGLLLIGFALCVLVGVGGALPRLQARSDGAARDRGTTRFDRLSQLALERIVLVLGGSLGAAAMLIAPDRAFQPWTALVIWAGGIVCTLIGIAQHNPRPAAESVTLRLRGWLRLHYLELAALAALMTLGFVLRGPGLELFPHNIHGDEGEMGLTARAILNGDITDPFATAWLSHPTLWFFLQAAALRLFGNSIGGLRMLSALMGTLAIPALFWFVRPLYGRSIAVMAAALLAVYHFHVHYSRIGLNNIADPLMITLTLGAFFHGYRTRSALAFAVAGVCMGLAQYFYFGSRLIPIIVVELLVCLLLWDRRGALAITRQVGWMLLTFLLTCGPLIRYFLAHREVFGARLQDHGLLQNDNLATLPRSGQSVVAALAEHAYRSIGAFAFSADHTLFYGAEIPLLDQFAAVLFIFGLALMVLRWRKPASIALLLWVGNTALFGGFLLVDPPQSTRYLIAAPALCLLVAIGLIQLLTLLRQMLDLSPRAYTGSVTCIALLMMIWNIYFYFDVYTPRNSYGGTGAITEVARFLQAQSGLDYVYMFTGPAFYLRHGTIGFIASQPQGIDVNAKLEAIATLPEPPAGLQPVFIFIPERLGELATVKQRYPNGQLHEYRNEPQRDHPIVYIYVPR